MARDAYAAEPVAASQHRHPNLTAETIALASKTPTRTGDVDAAGNPVLISFDSRLSCCGLLVSTLIPGAVYPDA